jgi:invasion protein IalB
VKDATDETKMVDALRKGADTVIKAVTSKGTRTTDTFSLKGISQALDRVAEECK